MLRRLNESGMIGEVGVILLAIAVRVAALFAFPQNLHDDRDNYVSIARELAEGNGYRNASTGEPTAFRPPLYPLLLTALFQVDGHLAVGVAQVVLGGLTTCLTMRIGKRLNLGSYSLLAGLFVAVDPILVQYTTFPMTEVLCAFLSALLLWSIVAARHGAALVAISGTSSTSPSAGWQIWIGLLFGLCTLSRPTYWLFGGFAALAWILRRATGSSAAPFPKWILLGIVLAVAPWFVRNTMVLGHPIVMTTHGGYTLLLGNNPMFYSEEVTKPWGTLWENAPPERSQEAWYRQTLEQMHTDLGDNRDEVAEDRWMSHRATRHIRDEPGLFVRACLLRLVRFWSVVPMAPARGSVPRIIWQGTGVFYTLVLVGFVAGLCIVLSKNRRDWLAIVLLVASFSAAHLVYWSNARMRAPVVPGIALISALGWSTIARSLRGSRDGRPEQFSECRKA